MLTYVLFPLLKDQQQHAFFKLENIYAHSIIFITPGHLYLKMPAVLKFSKLNSYASQMPQPYILEASEKYHEIVTV